MTPKLNELKLQVGNWCATYRLGQETEISGPPPKGYFNVLYHVELEAGLSRASDGRRRVLDSLDLGEGIVDGTLAVRAVVNGTEYIERDPDLWVDRGARRDKTQKRLIDRIMAHEAQGTA